jgi:hypothetical protein
MLTEIVPFGKYKGQPIETLQQDRAYCDWLVGQDWLQTRFPELRTIIINNFWEPDETPEHNALQAMFLDNRIALALIVAFYPEDSSQWRRDNVRVEFEYRGIDVIINGCIGIELKPTLGDDYPAVMRKMNSRRITDKNALVIGAYTGIGATLDQVRRMFAASGIRVLMVSEIEAMVETLPDSQACAP